MGYSSQRKEGRGRPYLLRKQLAGRCGKREGEDGEMCIALGTSSNKDQGVSGALGEQDDESMNLIDKGELELNAGPLLQSASIYSTML